LNIIGRLRRVAAGPLLTGLQARLDEAESAARELERQLAARDAELATAHEHVAKLSRQLTQTAFDNEVARQNAEALAAVRFELGEAQQRLQHGSTQPI
jgi:uncharacterized protein involved in exopolysaccharide biosynthesis